MTDLKIRLSEFPFLEDHKVHNLAIVPGMFFVASMAREYKRFSDINFVSFLPINSNNDLVRIESDDQGVVSFLSNDSSTAFASLRAKSSGSMPPTSPKVDDAPQTDAGLTLSGASLYATLQAQGNDYNDTFQGIQKVKQLDNSVTAHWLSQIAEQPDQRIDFVSALTTLLDSLTHIASFAAGSTHTYALQSIESIQFAEQPDYLSSATIQLNVVEKSGEQITANAIIYKPDNTVYCHVEGLVLKFLQENTAAAKHQIALASTFTLDPISDYANFWQRQLDNLVGTSFDEYGQVIQALLGANSIFDDKASKHVCLIRTQDLLKKASDAVTTRTAAPAISNNSSGDQKFENITLPDGRQVASLNKYETLYLYREIFADLSYSKHNVALLDGDTVIDIGANIGFFSMFASNEANDLKIIAVEPSPTVLPILQDNIANYAPSAVIEAAGASDKIGTAEFTAYRNSSVFSSFDADSASDEDAITAIVRNQIEETGISDQAVIDEAVSELMEGRLEFDTFTCPLISVSDIIDKHDLDQINLLKIDAEKSEEQIIAGIRDEHWDIIEQIIIEVHLQDNMDPTGIYNILESKGFTIAFEEENLLEASGLINLFAIKPERLERNKKQLIPAEAKTLISTLEDAAKAHSARIKTPLEIIFCPPSIDPPFSAGQLRAIETEATRRLETIPNTSAAQWSDFASRYPVSTVLDPVSDELGHIPYTPDWYASTATTLARDWTQQQRTPVKVLALDCDNTLWDGVVGEAGVEGIKINEGHQHLYQVIKDAVAGGMLICLLSKNNENDVWEVFQKRDDFAVQQSDIVAHRINWEPKANNIQSIASQLNLGLDSFVFIDDSALECAQMKEIQPQVLTLQLPADSRQFARLLNQYWPLDLDTTSVEDAARTKMYQDESKREELRSSTASLQSFIDSLDLEITFSALNESGMHRASQMTRRTNQFNLTTIRRSESDIQSLLTEGYTCQTLKVSDRFGDYGVTGLIITKAIEGVLEIDTFLLSCRILGRGVEHQLVQHLGHLAANNNCTEIAFRYQSTQKNQPAKTFLDALPAKKLLQDNDTRYVISSEAAISFEQTFQDVSVQKDSQQTSSDDQLVNGTQIDYGFIAANLGTVVQIRNAAEYKVAAKRPNIKTKFVAPELPLQATVSKIWCEVLGIDQVGINDNFFELGGSSLKGVQMVALLQQTIKEHVSVVDIFESSTVAELCIKIESGNEKSAVITESSRDRGAQRRQARSARPNRRAPTR